MADVRAVGEGGGSIIVNCVLSMHIRVFIQLSMHIPSTYEPFNSSCFVVAPFFVSLYSYGSINMAPWIPTSKSFASEDVCGDAATSST